MRNIISKKNIRKKHKKTSKKNYKRNSKSITRNKLIKLISRRKSRKIQYGGDILSILVCVALLIIFIVLVMHRRAERKRNEKDEANQEHDRNLFFPSYPPRDGEDPNNNDGFSRNAASRPAASTTAASTTADSMNAASTSTTAASTSTTAASTSRTVMGQQDTLTIPNIKKLAKELTKLETKLSMKNRDLYKQTEIYYKLDQNSQPNFETRIVIPINQEKQQLELNIKDKVQEMDEISKRAVTPGEDDFQVNKEIESVVKEMEDKELANRKKDFFSNQEDYSAYLEDYSVYLKNYIELNIELIELEAKLSTKNRDKIKNDIRLKDIRTSIDDTYMKAVLIETLKQSHVIPTNEAIEQLKSYIKIKLSSVNEIKEILQAIDGDVTAGGQGDPSEVDRKIEIIITQLQGMRKHPFFHRMISFAVACTFNGKKKDKEKITIIIDNVLSNKPNDSTLDKLQDNLRPHAISFRTDSTFTTGISNILIFLRSPRNQTGSILQLLKGMLPRSKKSLTSVYWSYLTKNLKLFIPNINVTSLLASFRKPLTAVQVTRIGAQLSELEQAANKAANSATVKTLQAKDTI